MLSQSEQDYLTVVYDMQHERGAAWVTTSNLAQRLGVTPASVTEMLKKLAAPDRSLLIYERYRGVRLSDAGLAAALEVVRHHRLIETFLSEALGYGWDEVRAEAHRLEHVISETMEDRMAAYLDQPQRDPHGAPIPQRNGVVAPLQDIPLSALAPGAPAIICRVLDDDPALLRYLSSLGMTLGAHVEVAGRAPFDGPMHVRVEEPPVTHALGAHVTDQVFVEVQTAPAE